VQAKLLRALQEGEIQPVGSGRVERVDVRVVASTNRDLAAEAAAGRFREDLYYRLAVVELIVPPLRDRLDDIPALAAEFARRYADKFGLPPLSLSPELIEALARSPWPGNVRQLENTIARMAALSHGATLTVADLAPVASAPTSDDEVPVPDGSLSLRHQVEAFERGVIARALAAAGGNQSEAARRLGMSRGALLARLRAWGLTGKRG
jgi:two-component system response regulator AtoC